MFSGPVIGATDYGANGGTAMPRRRHAHREEEKISDGVMVPIGRLEEENRQRKKVAVMR